MSPETISRRLYELARDAPLGTYPPRYPGYSEARARYRELRGRGYVPAERDLSPSGRHRSRYGRATIEAQLCADRERTRK